MSDFKHQLIKLGSTNPELRPHIRAILASRDTPLANLYENLEKSTDILLREHKKCEEWASDLVFQSKGEDPDVVAKAKALYKALIAVGDELSSVKPRLNTLKKTW